jgi:hypothetical protein
VPLGVEGVLALHRTAGNQAVCRYVDRARSVPGVGLPGGPAWVPAARRGVLARGPETATPAAAPTALDEVGFVREEGLNLRAQPDQKSGSLATLKFGTHVHVLEREDQHPGWHKVAVQGNSGFVFAPRIHFAPPDLIAKDPALKLIRVTPGQTFWGLVKEQYGIQGNEGTADQNINHFINAIRAVNKAEAFSVETDTLDDIGNAVVPGRDASDTKLKAGVDLWIPSFGVAAAMDVGSGTVSGEVARIIKKVEQKIADFKTACTASGKYIPDAIAQHTSEVSAALLEGLIDFALDAAKILAVSTAAGALIGALFGGVGAVPGAEIGFEIGLLILKLYGLALLIEMILSIAASLMSRLGDFISQVWSANGDAKKLDEAGKTLADALGILAGAALLAIVMYVTHRGMKALGETKFAKTVGQTELAKWLAERNKMTTTKGLAEEAGKGKTKTDGEQGKPPEETAKTPEEIAAEKKARYEERKRQQAAERRQKELERLEKEAKNRVEDLPEAHRKWIEADPRHKELSYDKAKSGWTEGSVQEAKAMLDAEAKGLVEGPVQRNIESPAPDFYDGKGKPVDHYGPRNLNPADDVASLYSKLTLQSYDVLLDGSGVSAAAEKAIIEAVTQQLKAAGKADRLGRVISERAPNGRRYTAPPP